MPHPDPVLSDAVLAFVGWDTATAVPGRHPDRVADAAVRARVLDVVARVDAQQAPGGDLQEWGSALARCISRDRPELTDAAVDALVALATFEWR